MNVIFKDESHMNSDANKQNSALIIESFNCWAQEFWAQNSLSGDAVIADNQF